MAMGLKRRQRRNMGGARRYASPCPQTSKTNRSRRLLTRTLQPPALTTRPCVFSTHPLVQRELFLVCWAGFPDKTTKQDGFYFFWHLIFRRKKGNVRWLMPQDIDELRFGVIAASIFPLSVAEIRGLVRAAKAKDARKLTIATIRAQMPLLVAAAESLGCADCFNDGRRTGERARARGLG